jgi:hypothetical protein
MANSRNVGDAANKAESRQKLTLMAFIAASQAERNPHSAGNNPCNITLKQENAAFLEEFGKPYVFKDLRPKVVNKKILPDCSKNAKKQMTKAILWANFSSQKRQEG